VHLASSWFTLSGAGGFKALISGVLLAIFLYSGWDTAAYVGEEAQGRKAGPAAVTSVVLLFIMYTVVIMAFQGVAASPSPWAGTGSSRAGSPWSARSTAPRGTPPSCSAC
jgi:amino acid transporter